MKLHLTILSLLINFLLQAQEEKQSFRDLDKNERSTNQVDSVKEKNLTKLSSVESKANEKINTLNHAGNKALDSLGRLQPENSLDHYNEEFESLRSKLSYKLDSLKSLQLPDQKLNEEISQLSNSLDSVTRLGPAKDIKHAQERLSSIQNELNSKAEKIGAKLNEKMDLFSKNGGNMPGSLNLPDADLNTSLNLNTNLYLPNVNLPSVDDPLSKIENPLGKVDDPLGAENPLGNVELGSSSKLTDISKLSDTKIGDIKGLEELGKVQEKLGAVNEVSEKVKGYQEDITKLKEGDLSKMEALPDAIESKVENLDELDGFKDQIKDFEAVKKNWNDPEVMKEEALNKAKETAINHFAGHEEELKAVMEKMSKLKAKIPDPEGAIDLFAKRQQFMKGKPITERLVPGLAFQLQRNNSYWFDLNPQIGFKISSRWLAGLGWNERFAYDFKEFEWDKKYHVYGVRTYIQFKLKDSMWLKADVEDMNAPKRATWHMNSEIVGRHWVWSFFGGIKKDFQSSKGFKANVQTLYNIYNPGKRSPYTSRLNIRMGFEIPLKKTAKTSEK